MRPKRNVSSRGAPQQPPQSSKARRAEEASTGGTGGAHRARPSADAASCFSKGHTKGSARHDFTPPLAESHSRRLGVIPGVNRIATRPDALHLSHSEQRSIFNKNVTTKIGPSKSTLYRTQNFSIYNSDIIRNRNTSNVGLPDRARYQHKPSTRNISGKSHVSVNAQPKCRSSKKRLKKSHMIGMSFKDNSSRDLNSDKIYVMEQLQNTLGMAVAQSDEFDSSMDEVQKYGAPTIQQPQHELYNVTSQGPETLSFEIEKPKSDLRPDGEEPTEKETESTPNIENSKEQAPFNVISAPESSHESHITPDDITRGWERVLLSLQVQMSPLSSPSESTTILEDQPYISHKHSCKVNRTFQTTSEILVLPIFARQHHSQQSFNVSNKSSDPGIGPGPIGSALMKEILECKNYEIESDKPTNIDQTSGPEIPGTSLKGPKEKNLDIMSKVLTHEQMSPTCKIIDFSTANEICNNNNTIINHEDFRIMPTAVGTPSGLLSQKDLTFPIFSHKENTHFFSENIVTELQLNQNDIVKMAYEIIDIVSKIHVNRTICSQSSENVKDGLNAFRRGRSVDLIVKRSDRSIPSARTAHSLKNFDIDTRMDVAERIVNALMRSESGEQNVSSNSCSTKDIGEERTTENINSNVFKFPKKLPILLYQNKQVHKILKHFVSKLEENDEDCLKTCDDFIVPSISNIEINVSSGEGSTSKPQGDTQDVGDEKLTEDEKQAINDFPDLKEKQELGVNTMHQIEEKVDFGVNVCLSENQTNTLHDKSAAYEESTASEADTEKSLGVDSEAGAEDGDDEATASASESVEEQVEPKNNSSEDPAKSGVCMCHEKENICPRHPAQNEETVPEGSCQCERFQELCTDSQAPLSSNFQENREEETRLSDVNDLGVQNKKQSSANGSSVSFDLTKSGSWVPWVSSGSKAGIPDFNPSGMDNVSSVTLPPRAVQNAMDLIKNRDDDLSVFGSGIRLPPWLPEDVRDDQVPETITEFHWMPDDLRGFSSTIINPEIPDDVVPYTAEDRPLLCRPHSTPEQSVSGFITQTSSRKTSDATRVVTNPDAPSEVPHGAYTASLDVAVGGTFFDVLANTMEKSISPLKSAIDDLKTKIDRLETAHIASMRPDILVGVTSVPTCSACSGQSSGSETRATSCVPPFGLYILHQRSSLAGNTAPLSANKESKIENANQRYYVPGKSPLPCVRCIDKLQEVSPSTENTPNVENSDSLRPPTPFLCSPETPRDGNIPARFEVNEESQLVSQPNLPPSKSQMSDRCICKSLDQLQSSETMDESRAFRCPKCNKCSPSQILVNSPDGCDTCCNQPDAENERDIQLVNSQVSGDKLQTDNSDASVDRNIQNTENNICGACKTCISNVSSLDTVLIAGPTFVNVPCYQCCNGPVLRKMPRDYPWYRLKNCHGCRQCSYPPPCPPFPPPKPKLSPIAQMYLDMSRAKYDWSDMTEGKKEYECDKTPTKFEDEILHSTSDEKGDAAGEEISEKYSEQVDSELIKDNDSIMKQDPEGSMLNEQKDEAEQALESTDELLYTMPEKDEKTGKGLDDKSNFPARKFPCVCPKDFCIPPEKLQQEENKTTKITDDELDIRKINYPCVCPRDHCVPPEVSQQDVGVASESIQDTSEQVAENGGENV